LNLMRFTQAHLSSLSRSSVLIGDQVISNPRKNELNLLHPKIPIRKVVLSSLLEVTKQFPSPPLPWTCMTIFVFLLIPAGSTGS